MGLGVGIGLSGGDAGILSTAGYEGLVDMGARDLRIIGQILIGLSGPGRDRHSYCANAQREKDKVEIER